VKVSKDTEQLRDQEQFILTSYKEYLQVLEVFSNVKVSKLSKQTVDKSKSSLMYIKLRECSLNNYCFLLERHPNFNFRLNILQVVASKLSNQDTKIRTVCT
jgi:hypothetical protein